MGTSYAVPPHHVSEYETLSYKMHQGCISLRMLHVKVSLQLASCYVWARSNSWVNSLRTRAVYTAPETRSIRRRSVVGTGTFGFSLVTCANNAEWGPRFGDQVGDSAHLHEDKRDIPPFRQRPRDLT